MRYLGIVLKTVEVCNLNCSYCYFFNGIDDSFKKHPPYISKETIKSVAKFIIEGGADLGFEGVRIGLHGGEPLMQKRDDFDWMCNYFQTELSKHFKEVEFTLQTNGVLLNSEWMDLIQRYKIGIGVSVDGPKEYHDKYRVDHRNRGSYDRVAAKIKFFMEESSKRNMNSIGALSVMNPDLSGKAAYRHFVDELGLESFNFLLPDNNYAIPPTYSINEYGKFMCDVFDEWIKDNNPNIKVRFISSILGLFFGKSSIVYGIGPSVDDGLPLITVSSNGDLSPVDELRSTDPSIMNIGNVYNTNLKDFLNNNIFKEIKNAQNTMPKACKECCYEKICGAGSIVNRFSKENRFDNPSIYCEGLKSFYAKVVAYLIKSNYPMERIEKLLAS